MFHKLCLWQRKAEGLFSRERKQHFRHRNSHGRRFKWGGNSGWWLLLSVRASPIWVWDRLQNGLHRMEQQIRQVKIHLKIQRWFHGYDALFQIRGCVKDRQHLHPDQQCDLCDEPGRCGKISRGLPGADEQKRTSDPARYARRRAEPGRKAHDGQYPVSPACGR